MGDLISQNNRKYIKFTMTVNQKRTGSVNRPGHPSSFRSAHCTLICKLSCSSDSTQITTFFNFPYGGQNVLVPHKGNR